MNNISSPPTIAYTLTDEAPALATYSLLPIIQAFTHKAGIVTKPYDISLAGRLLAAFPEKLGTNPKTPDDLANLADLILQPQANIIKLPNISASIPQLKAAIKELQQQGYPLPDYPDVAHNDQERAIKARYDKIKGSAVNPVLRQGNSDRRAPLSVKQYARKHPPKMNVWARADSKTHVAHMTEGDFYGSEQSKLISTAGSVKIEFTADDHDHTRTVLKENITVQAQDILDIAVMRQQALRDFLRAQIDDAKQQGVLFSVHLKATMMKVSDPIIFGHVVAAFYQDVLTQHADTLQKIGFDANNGMSDLYTRLATLPADKQAEINAAIQAENAKRPALAMVDVEKHITNLHVPSNVIIDASMPAMIRDGGKMWGPDGKLADTKAVIPDRCYAGIYQTVIDDCKKNGAFNPVSLGSVANVGLMAQAAEEYGSHDKTFLIATDGVVRVLDETTGQTLLEQRVTKGDIFRMCQTKDAPIQNWIQLALQRAHATGTPAVFWLDPGRAHDALLIKKVNGYLNSHAQDVKDLTLSIKTPVNATRFTLERLRAGQDTIAVTGNVLRDYLTDLFPILELGTSAKMLSIVPLMAGGGLFETGAGGSAPKHVQQFIEEGFLRWDSLGEFLALTASLEHLGETQNNNKAKVLASTLDSAINQLLDKNKSPGRKKGELDNRGSHFYLTLYWAQALAAQTQEASLQTPFATLAQTLTTHETDIVNALSKAQGQPVDLKGYYHPDPKAAQLAMRPSPIFNKAIDTL